MLHVAFPVRRVVIPLSLGFVAVGLLLVRDGQRSAATVTFDSCSRLLHEQWPDGQAPCTEYRTCFELQVEEESVLKWPVPDAVWDLAISQHRAHMLGQLVAARDLNRGRVPFKDVHQLYAISKTGQSFENYQAGVRASGLLSRSGLFHSTIWWTLGNMHIPWSDIIKIVCDTDFTSIKIANNVNSCMHGVGHAGIIRASNMQDSCGKPEITDPSAFFVATQICDGAPTPFHFKGCLHGLHHGWFEFFDFQPNNVSYLFPCDDGTTPAPMACFQWAASVFGQGINDDIRWTDPTGNNKPLWRARAAKWLEAGTVEVCNTMASEEAELGCIKGVSSVIFPRPPFPWQWDAVLPAHVEPHTLGTLCSFWLQSATCETDCETDSTAWIAAHLDRTPIANERSRKRWLACVAGAVSYGYSYKLSGVAFDRGLDAAMALAEEECSTVYQLAWLDNATQHESYALCIKGIRFGQNIYQGEPEQWEEVW
mmetsp:Transcript_45222/g.90308  ORF Transcript_45222/g.90308 Transcript_45222/m.90308 type:complete len:481 (-) Transcript_45222:498-1940(-)